MLTNRIPTRMTPTPAHWCGASRSRRNRQASSTVMTLKSDASAVTTVA